jgi:hypothetical protein
MERTILMHLISTAFVEFHVEKINKYGYPII